VLEGENGWRLGFSTGGHTADLVPIFAAGTGALDFSGLHAVDEVGRLLAARVVPREVSITD
jgi:alkaline phosphatase